MSRKKDNKEKDILSFDELKDKLKGQNEPQSDPEMDALLSDLKQISDSLPPAAPKEELPPEPQAAEPAPPTEAQDYKSIYNDVLKSVMETGEKNEKTTRKSKYLQNEGQFVDVTKAYETYGTTAPEEKAAEVQEPDTAAAIAPTEADLTKLTKEYRSFNQILKDCCHAIFPSRHDSVAEGVRKVVMDLAVLALVCCAGYFISYGVQNYQAKKQQNKIQGQVIDADDSTISSDSDAWADFVSKYPNVQLPEGMMKKYAYLYAINPDLVGWIKVPNTKINIQVVQPETHDEYLRKDFYGGGSRYGTPYMDYRDDPKYLSQNTTIYGHHMSDGLVFADLAKYESIDAFKETPVFYFDTLYKSYAFKIYAVIISNSQEKEDDGYIFNYTIPNFRSGDHFMSYIQALDERKLYTTGVDIRPDDKILTLSTCTYEFPDARLAVVGRMVRDGEDETVDTSLATPNPTPRYPQAWYDKKGETNPFAGAPKWLY